MKLSKSYYQSENVVDIARNLLGKVLFTSLNNKITSGIISETEAYAGIRDRASHAYNGRRTNRTEVMYREGGFSYVYLCYGIHYLFNVVTGPENQPHAVLIRSILPFNGIDEMARRLGKKFVSNKFTNGPGKLSKALGISMQLNNKLLTGNKIWIEDLHFKINEGDIIASTRIGVGYAKEDALLPYRFNLIPDLQIF